MKNFITLQLVFNLAITLQGFHLIAFKIDRLHTLTSFSFFLSYSLKKEENCELLLFYSNMLVFLSFLYSEN